MIFDFSARDCASNSSLRARARSCTISTAQDGRYLAGSLRNEEPPVNYTANELNEARYSPDAIRRLGTR